MSPASTVSPSKRALCRIRAFIEGEVHTLATLIDSGSDLNILDETLAHQLGVRTRTLSEPVQANALDGHILGRVRSRVPDTRSS